MANSEDKREKNSEENSKDDSEEKSEEKSENNSEDEVIALLACHWSRLGSLRLVDLRMS